MAQTKELKVSVRSSDKYRMIKNRTPYGQALELVKKAASAVTDECIDFPGKRKARMRPTIRYQGKTTVVPRLVWTLAHGDPGDQQVLHTCHRGEDCINIRHLYLGSPKQNSDDREQAGRNPTTKLTPDQVREIRRRYIKGSGNSKELAEEFGVTTVTIQSAASGRRYKYVKEVE